MGATATLDTSTFAVVPGGEAAGQLSVRNTGEVVDEFSFQALGEGAPWIDVEPATLRLFPGDDGTVTVWFRPPRSPTVAPGELPFGVKVVSSEDPEGSVVEEGSVEVGAFTDLSAELLPHTSKARRRASHELAVDNRGNERVQTDITAYDDAEALRFDIDPPALVSEPGTAGFATIEARPQDWHWRGPPLSHMFEVLVQAGDGGEPLQLDGTMVQEPVFPAWLPRALLGLLGLLVVLAVLWLTLLRPTVESAAREAVQEPLAQMQQDNAAQQAQVDQAAENAERALERTGATPPPPVEVEPELVEAPFDRRLEASHDPDAGPGAPGTDAFPVEEADTLRLTDVVLENPDGHSGTVRLRRSGDVLLQLALQNFRSLDYHFVSPVVFVGGDVLVLEVVCGTPAEGAEACEAAAYVTGELVSPATEAPGGGG